ncbi:nitrate reductase molybdenum cofactor assembly chaperone [Marinithermus hydrothermalis]|uniref:Nitrate reductase molybdenum cofactor assembly chaperone n=1 Tax=Marinithermus hydrothermalis (strain DSM 14884 / JCM 11576 / T1) TaxID=869210 RepID=F2NQZ9_MARHT|nr:nitrate reductase molybdenum cofactor assembly chaperone [Marinithermus hydrothermalis DSM 14884]
MHALEVLADALTYPAPGRLEALTRAAVRLPKGPVRRGLERFLARIETLSLAGWEECFTRTLDLTPIVVPYVGYVIYGESYQRGAFMAALKRAMEAAGVELEGELPDHLVPVLRYLAVAQHPLPDLVEVLPRAVQQMERTLATLDPTNPYRPLLEAVRHAVASLEAVKQGGER